MQILDIQDNYRSNIRFNESLVYSITPTSIQVAKKLLDTHPNNTLHILIKSPPKLVTNDLTAKEQNVDLPMELIECLILGIAAKANDMGVLSNDPRTGTSYVVNPYIDRYELAIKKAIDNCYLMPQSLLRKDYYIKGLV